MAQRTLMQRDNDAPGKVHDTAGGLPEHCFTTLLSDPTKVIGLARGVIGYKPCPHVTPNQLASLNEGITPAQLEAMKAGSMFGWDVPGADPANYDEQGRPRRDVPDATKPTVNPEAPTQHWLGAEDRDTILAALRFYQDHLDNRRPDLNGLEDIATNGGTHEAMDSDEIDELCERINCG